MMESVKRFITTKLKLKVNESKSAVAKPQQRKFLGFSFTSGKELKRKIAPKAIDRFKERVREITGRIRGISMDERIKELAQYMRGWLGYFGFCKPPSVFDQIELVGPEAYSMRLLAAVEDRPQPLSGAGQPGRTSGLSGGYGRSTTWVLESESEPGSDDRPAQCLSSLVGSRSYAYRKLNLSNRRIRDPYVRWCGRGDGRPCSPMPIHGRAPLNKAESQRVRRLRWRGGVGCLGWRSSRSSAIDRVQRAGHSSHWHPLPWRRSIRACRGHGKRR